MASFIQCVSINTIIMIIYIINISRWGAADTEIRVPVPENAELSNFPSFRLGIGRNIFLSTSYTDKVFCLSIVCLSASFSFIYFLVLFKHKCRVS